MKSTEFIAIMLFTWTCAMLSSAVVIALGVPWDYALSHTVPACMIGTGVSFLLSRGVERWVRRVEAALELRHGR